MQISKRQRKQLKVSQKWSEYNDYNDNKLFEPYLVGLEILINSNIYGVD